LVFAARRRDVSALAERYQLKKLKNIAAKHIYAYVEDMQERELSAATIKTDLSAIRFFYDKIDDANNILPPNSDLDIERRSYGKEDRSWSQREVMRFLMVCYNNGRHDYVAVTTIAYYAGFRISECFKIDTAIAAKAIRTGALTSNDFGSPKSALPLVGETPNPLKIYDFVKPRSGCYVKAISSKLKCCWPHYPPSVRFAKGRFSL
jgi:site-specific recombinase XerD